MPRERAWRFNGFRARTMAKSEQIRAVFVGSGRTAWDEAGRVGGACDLPLTAAGLATVRAQLPALAGAKLSAILTSNDEASKQTAALVAAAAEGLAPRIRPIEGLADACMGLWEGLRHAELEEKFPKVYKSWREDPEAVIVPEGETLSEAQTRIVQALGSPFGRAGGDGAIAVVLRPMALTLVRCWVDAAPLRNVWSMVNEAPGLMWRTIPRDQLRRKPAPVRMTA